jgi:hypothetical protein
LYKGINDIKKKHFSRILNVHGAIDVSETEIHPAEPLVTEPSAFEVDLATEKLKIHKLSGIDQILAELFKAGGRKIRCEIHKRITSFWNKEELPEEWKESIVVPMYKKSDKRDSFT